MSRNSFLSLSLSAASAARDAFVIAFGAGKVEFGLGVSFLTTQTGSGVLPVEFFGFDIWGVGAILSASSSSLNDRIFLGAFFFFFGGGPSDFGVSALYFGR
jgi:hypothetical protein